MILRYDIADKKTILPSIPILKTLDIVCTSVISKNKIKCRALHHLLDSSHEATP
jgi:hypothetical protein